MLIDTHAHLYLDQFDEDRNETIKRAIEQGVNQILLPNIDVDSLEPMMSLCADFPNNCFPMMGLHPCSVHQDFERHLDIIYSRLNKESIIAIGEIGIDLYWDKSTLDLQRQAFRHQVDWAKKLDLPIVIHARDSYNELFEELNVLNDSSLRGVFHCFTGSLQQAEKILSYGDFFLGIGGVLTYKNSGISRFVGSLPLDKIVLETDSPYLPPVPHRGQRNESAYVPLVAQKLAECYGLSVDDIADATTKNAQKLFRLNL